MGMIRAEKLVFEYDKRDEEGNVIGSHRAIDGVDIDVPQGSFVAILGHNGSGKSTLAKHMNAILVPTGGTMWVDGRDTKDPNELWNIRQSAGMVFQNPDNQIIGTVVEEEVGFGPENLGVPTDEIWKRVENSLRAVGMLERRKDSPNKLSGGQKRRLALMLILLDEPNVLILDEPGNDLDTDMLAIVEDLLDGWPGTLILVTHDRFLMERVTDQQWALLDGHLTHMPGGVDQYLRLCNATAEGEPVGAPSAKTGTFDTGAAAVAADKPKASGQPNGLSNAERQKLRREVSSLERKMETQRARVEEAEAAMAQVDPTNYAALGEQQAKIDEAHAVMDELEMAWLEASEKLEGEE